MACRDTESLDTRPHIITGPQPHHPQTVTFGTTGSSGRPLLPQKLSTASDTLVNVSWRAGTVIWLLRLRLFARTAVDRARNRACPSRSRHAQPLPSFA